MLSRLYDLRSVRLELILLSSFRFLSFRLNSGVAGRLRIATFTYKHYFTFLHIFSRESHSAITNVRPSVRQYEWVKPLNHFTLPPHQHPHTNVRTVSWKPCLENKRNLISRATLFVSISLILCIYSICTFQMVGAKGTPLLRHLCHFHAWVRAVFAWATSCCSSCASRHSLYPVQRGVISKH